MKSKNAIHIVISTFVIVLLVNCKKNSEKSIIGEYKIENYTQTYDDNTTESRKKRYWYQYKKETIYCNAGGSFTQDFYYIKGWETDLTIHINKDGHYSIATQYEGDQTDWEATKASCYEVRKPYSETRTDNKKYTLTENTLEIAIPFEDISDPYLVKFTIKENTKSKLVLYGETKNTSGYTQRHNVVLIKK